MSEESCRKRLCDEGTCPVCLNYLTDPVTLDCGHNFCSCCIERVKVLPYRRLKCPLCTEVVQRKKLKPNTQLANMLEVVQDLSNLLQHRSVCSAEEAEKEFAKDQLSRALEVLMNERIKLSDFKDREEMDREEFHKQMRTDREKTSAAFTQLHDFLDEQEDLFLDQSEAVEAESGKLWDKHLAIISEELSSLDSLIKKLEEKLKKSSKELLQHSGDILERCKKEKFCKKSLEFPIALRWQNHDCHDRSSFLVGIMNQFKESLGSGVHLKEANVKLDPDTAHPSLILPEDGKSVRGKDEHQDRPNNPERFMDSPYVLGNKGFRGGRHYWDVSVSNEEDWSVGVAFKCPNGKVYYAILMGIWDGEFGVSFPKTNFTLNPDQDLKKIRVTVNYAASELGFYNSDTGRKLCCVSTEPPYDGVMLLPCFTVSRRGHLTLCP